MSRLQHGWYSPLAALAPPAATPDITVVANTGKAGSANGVTSDAIDTTGATGIVLAVSSYSASEIAGADITDSKGNTWTALTRYGNATPVEYVRLFYCASPTVGSGHTFTATKTGTYCSIAVLAMAGMKATSPADQAAGADSGAAGASSLQPGSITPTEPNEIVISAVAHNLALSPNVDSGMTISNNVNFGSGVNIGLTMAYIIQTDIDTINPTWSTVAALLYATASVSLKKA